MERQVKDLPAEMSEQIMTADLSALSTLPTLDVLDMAEPVDPAIGLAPNKDEISARKVLDMRRWMCQVRPQYHYACGISSLVSVWNFLYSTLGAGTQDPITVEQALTALGFTPPFSTIKFGPFTGNATLQLWFSRLCRAFGGVAGRCGYLYKPVGQRSTPGVTPAMALRRTATALRSPKCAVIYHCHNHYACLIGYEATPNRPVLAYRGLEKDELPWDVGTWFIMSDSSRTSMPLRSIRWSTILQDLNCSGDEFLNVRQLHLGVQSRKAVKAAKAMKAKQNDETLCEAVCVRPTQIPTTTFTGDLVMPMDQAKVDREDLDEEGGEEEENDSTIEREQQDDGEYSEQDQPEQPKKRAGNVNCLMFFSSDPTWTWEE